VGVVLRHGRRDFVVAIGGSSCCGGTSEGDFGKKKGVLLLAEHAKALGSSVFIRKGSWKLKAS